MEADTGASRLGRMQLCSCLSSVRVRTTNTPFSHMCILRDPAAYGISLFLPYAPSFLVVPPPPDPPHSSIINSLGFSPASSQLLTVPPYVFAALLGVAFALLSDAHKIRWPFVAAGQAMCILGFGIQISNAHFAVKYFGTFWCVAGSYGMFPGLASW